MTLTPEEIEMIEREAKEYSEIFAMHDRESVCAGFMEGAAVYLTQLKQVKKIVSDLLDQLDDTKKLLYEERERSAKLMEEIRVYQRYPDEIPKCRTATASLDSLAASLGISKPYVVLKNVEK